MVLVAGGSQVWSDTVDGSLIEERGPKRPHVRGDHRCPCSKLGPL